MTFVDWCWDHAADADVTQHMAASDAAVAVFSLADGKSFTRAAVAAVAYGSKRPVVFVGTHSDGTAPARPLAEERELALEGDHDVARVRGEVELVEERHGARDLCINQPVSF